MQMKLALLFLTLLLYIYSVFSSENCLNLQLSISQNIENEGFHRDINWLVEALDLDIESWNKSSCRISLLLNVPPGIFVNPDQIADLTRIGQISACIEGEVNVETPAHESEGHAVYIFLTDRNLQKVLVQLPIHLRYQRAAIAGGFGKVNLPKPSLLVYCPNEKVQICGKQELLNAPCDVTASRVCSWQNVTYQALFDEVQLFVPIGDLDDYPLVSIVTLLLGCAGSIYILSLLSTAPL